MSAEALPGTTPASPIPGTVASRPRFSIRKDEAGRLVPRHHSGLDPGLVGERAYTHPAVQEWWRWLREEYRPPSPVALVTPCSNVKPYTRSPTSRKVRGLLRRLGLWGGGAPRGVTWLYFSDLLILVPYERAGDYPACCYEAPPDLVLGSQELRSMVTSLLAEAVERLVERGLREAVVFLPRKHLTLWREAREKAAKWPREYHTGYTIFSTRSLEKTLRKTLSLHGQG